MAEIRNNDDYGSILSFARQVAGNMLQEVIKANSRPDRHDWGWIMTSPFRPFFQHICFSFKNQIISVLVDPYDTKTKHSLLSEQDKKNQIRECKNNNLVPCTFPIDINEMKPFQAGWNLFNTESGNPVNPSEIASDLPIEMSSWEIGNMGIQHAIEYLKKEGCQICSFCDVPNIYPQVWFIKKGEQQPSSLTVRAVSSGDNRIFSISSALFEGRMKQYSHYFINVQFASPMGIGDNKLFRGSPFYVNLRGIEELPDAIKKHDFLELKEEKAYQVK